jgi:hypothetical protein
MGCQERRRTTAQTVVSFYIYYRVAAERAVLARRQIDSLQDQLAQSTGIRGRLMTKRGEPTLWMEIYEDVPDAAPFEHALLAAVHELRIDELLVAGTARHLECFECA